MQVRSEVVLDAPLEAVLKVVRGEALLDALVDAQPEVQRAEVVRVVEGDGGFERTVRFHAVPKVVDVPGGVAWEETVRWDGAASEGRFTVDADVPDRVRGRFSCEGRYALEVLAGGRTKRTIEVDIRVRVPVVGRLAERHIAKQVEGRFAAEGAILAELTARAVSAATP